MKKWTIRQKILASFALVIAAMAVMAGVAYQQLRIIEEQAIHLHQWSLPEALLSTQLLSAFDQNFSIMQELVIQESASDFSEIRAELEPNRAEMNDLAGKLGPLTDTQGERDQLAVFQKKVAPLVDSHS